MTRTILVSGASGIVGYGILKSLRQSHPGYRLIGTSIYADCVAPAFCDVFELAPPTGDAGYIPWLLSLIERHGISLIIPGIEIDVFAWNAHRDVIEAAGAKVLLNDPDLIRLCADKWMFYLRLRDAGSPYAIPTALKFDANLHQFPLLLKPRSGSGSKGIVIVENRDQLDEHAAEIGPHLMLQPIVGAPDQEYTVSAFFDRDSRLCASMTLRRTLSQNGYTETAETVEGADPVVALTDLARIFHPVGPTNFQFRVDRGQWKILEINPRVSSATSIRAAFGYNESAMAVEFLLHGMPPVQPDLRRGRAVRYVEDVIYYDRPDL